MKKLNFALFLLVGVVIISSCHPQVDSEIESIDPIILSAKVSLNSNSSGKISSQHLEIELDPIGFIPGFILVKGRPLYDNGEGNDLIAGDNIFSSIDSITFTESSPAGRQNATDWYFKCSFDASLKGGQCNGETCPDKTYWGNDTWFCVCFDDCSFCLGTNCGEE